MCTNIVAAAVIGIIGLSVSVLCEDEEKALYTALFADYNKKVRPRLDPGDPVHVDIELELMAIKALDDHAQTIEVIGYLNLEWYDDHIRWDPDMYAGLKALVLPPGDLWLPDVAIINSAEQFYDDSYTTDFRVKVDYHGKMDWAFGGIFKTNCEVDLTFYPFDLQLCDVSIENWAYNSKQVELTNGSNRIHLDEYHENGEWDLTATGAAKEDIYHESYPGIAYPKVNFSLYLERKWSYVMLNILVPCISLVVMTVFIFFLPADSGERVSLGVTMLLAFSVFQLILLDNTPKSSDNIPVLSIYLLFLMGICTLCTLQSICVLYLHHHATTSRPPRAVRLLAFRYLARFLFMTKLVPEVTDNDEEENTTTDDKESASSEKALMHNAAGEGASVSSISVTQEQLQEEERQRWRDADKDDAIANEWKCVGYVVDRLFFYLILVLVIIVTPILLARKQKELM